MAKILILFYTRYGNTAQMAEEIALGAKEVVGESNIVFRRIADDVPMQVIEQNSVWHQTHQDLEKRYPSSSLESLIQEIPDYDAIIFGSPTRFGNMGAPMKALWDRTSSLWMNGSLIGKVGAVFTSAASVHGGQETTAVSMMFPMFHHGMIIVGVPYSVPELTQTGSPYGPSRIVGPMSNRPIEEIDKKVAQALGKRVAEISIRLTIGKEQKGEEEAKIKTEDSSKMKL